MTRRRWVLVFLATALQWVLFSEAEARFLQTDPVGYRDDNNLYVYVGDDPTDKIDPTGMDAYIRVQDNGDVDITIPILFAGDAATPENISKISKNISQTWTGKFGGVNVTTKIQQLTPDEFKKALLGNTVNITNAPTDQNQGHSYVKGGFDADITMKDIKSEPIPTGKPNETSTSNKGQDTAAHEGGHLLGLPDVKGDNGGIMDEGHGTGITGADIQVIVHSPNNRCTTSNGNDCK